MQVTLNKIHTCYANSLMPNQVTKPLSNLISMHKSSDSFGLTDAMRAKIREVTTFAKSNIMLLQITDTGLQKADACLQRMQELTVKALDNTLTEADRSVIQREINLIRADMERNALETENKIREKLGLPQAKGHWEPIGSTDVGAVAADYQRDGFDTGRFIHDEDSDAQFIDYITDMKLKARQNHSKLQEESADTLDKIWNALTAMRPKNLGVDKLDVTTVEKAQASLEKIIKARETVSKAKEMINGEIKKWSRIMEGAYFGEDYSWLLKDNQRSSYIWDLVLDVTA
ncbi:MAG: hypothetical protein ACM3PE_12715 [Deltaproteobacteria bacterium]